MSFIFYRTRTLSRKVGVRDNGTCAKANFYQGKLSTLRVLEKFSCVDLNGGLQAPSIMYYRSPLREVEHSSKTQSSYNTKGQSDFVSLRKRTHHPIFVVKCCAIG